MAGINPNYVYKSSKPYIITMEKLPDTITNEGRKVTDKRHAWFRADKLRVTDITNKFDGTKKDSVENTIYKKKSIIYKVGEIVGVDDFDTDMDKIDTTGIHYFCSREVAFFFEQPYTTRNNFSSWYDDGQPQIRVRYPETDGLGEFVWWHENGRVHIITSYLNGEQTGAFMSWDENGRLEESGLILDGKIIGTWAKY
jgi:Family of unknown function (DUF5758)